MCHLSKELLKSFYHPLIRATSLNLVLNWMKKVPSKQVLIIGVDVLKLLLWLCYFQ